MDEKAQTIKCFREESLKMFRDRMKLEEKLRFYNKKSLISDENKFTVGEILEDDKIYIYSKQPKLIEDKREEKEI